MNSININVAGYPIAKALYTRSRTLVYQGIRETDDRFSVVLKSPKNVKI